MKRNYLSAFLTLLVFVTVCRETLCANDNLNPLTRIFGVAHMGRLINEERAANGLPALAFDSVLLKTAQDYAVTMAKNPGQYPSHDIGMTLAQRMQQHGVGGAIRENIHRSSSMDSSTIENVVRHPSYGWMNYRNPSTGRRQHRENLLFATGTKMGIGITRSTQDNKLYFCLVISDRAGNRPLETTSSGGGEEVRRITVENYSGRTLSYRFRMPARSWIDAYWTEVYTLQSGGRSTYYLPPRGTILQAVSVGGQRTNATVATQAERRHIALGSGAVSIDPSGRTQSSYGVSWNIR